ncbi:MAG: tetratricopeptide repeat protein [Verrucomicrobia bacterium]|nr:tetratricopeptide repeat protein [Verrucomicrobiota bacterium]
MAHLAYKSGSICDAKKATQDYISALEKLLATKQERSEGEATHYTLAWTIGRLAMIEEALGHTEIAEQIYQRAAREILLGKMRNTKLEDLKHHIVTEPYYDKVFGPVVDRAKLTAWKERKGDWEKTTVELHSTKSAGIKRVAAKQCLYKYRFALGHPDFGDASVLITVFVTDSDEIWAGPEQDFYVETDSGIVGGTVSKWLLWCDSLVGKRPPEKDTVDSLPGRFDKQVGGYDLSNAIHGSVMDGGSYSDSIMRGRYTFFRDSLGRDFDEKVVEPDGRAYRAVQVTGNTLRLDVRGRGGFYAGSVFVDIKSHKVLKCTVDGKGVFPKATTPAGNDESR